MRISLVAMPWPSFTHPSAALGSLSAFLAAHEPRWEVVCSYAYVQLWSQLEPYYEFISSDPYLGELVHATHLYPDRTEPLREQFLRRFEHVHGLQTDDLPTKVWSGACQATEDHLHQLANELGKGFDVVGFTTTFAQLFPSISVAQRLKQINPAITIVLGGWSAQSCHSLLHEYAFLDHIIVGEGEFRLLALLRWLASGGGLHLDIDGVRSRDDQAQESEYLRCRQHSSLPTDQFDLESLPTPQYEEYGELAEEHNIFWYLPVEGSRGCWWDRSRQLDDPRKTCLFCSMNSMSTYRCKSAAKLGAELVSLTERHRTTRISFTDTVFRRQGDGDLFDELRSHGKSYQFSMAVRAGIHPEELLQLKEAGCTLIEIGLEGLSTSYLRRLNKGTTTIQNLQVMRACFELEIPCSANLVLSFPGTTADEVEEIRHNIMEYGICYAPATSSEFKLTPNSAVYHLPDSFAISSITAAEVFRLGLPAEVCQRLGLPWLDYNVTNKQVDWSGVRAALDSWRQLHQELRIQQEKSSIAAKPMFYYDGGTFLEIIDRRRGFRIIRLIDLWREVYLYCMEIRTETSILERFANHAAAEKITQEILTPLKAEGLVFEENGRFLSLAVACSPTVAIRRMNAVDH